MSSNIVNVEHPQLEQNKSKNKDLLEVIKKLDLDLFMCFDVFYLLITWLFLIAQKESESNYASNGFAWYVSLIFIIDLMFRLLSLKIESMIPSQWNHLWLCLFPVVFTMIAGSYGYKNAIYGKQALQVWNALFYTCYIVGSIACGIYRKIIE